MLSLIIQPFMSVWFVCSFSSWPPLSCVCGKLDAMESGKSEPLLDFCHLHVFRMLVLSRKSCACEATLSTVLAAMLGIAILNPACEEAFSFLQNVSETLLSSLLNSR